MTFPLTSHGESTRCEDARVARIVDFFEQFGEQDIARLDQYYAAGACFKDPFNEVQGLPAIRQVYLHMFRTLDAPHFVVHDILVQGDQCFLVWAFHFRFRRFRSGDQTVHGSSHLKFNALGLIDDHRDYWDAAEELYEKLPVVGTFMRWLKARANS